MGAIILREMLDIMKSFRFCSLLVLSILFFILNGLVFAPRYEKDATLYTERQSQEKSRERPNLLKRPNPLQFIAEAREKSQNREYRVNPGGEIFPYDTPSLFRNYTLPEIPEPDWSFIVRIVFSLSVLLLSYGAISEERDRGTLTLALSNPLSRITFLTGKYCAILLSSGIALAGGALVNLLVIGFTAPGIITAECASRFFLAMTASLAFLSLFIFMGLLVSATVRRSSDGLLILLFIWAIWFIIPGVSGTIARNIPSGLQVYTAAKEKLQFDRDHDFWSVQKFMEDEIRRKNLNSEEEIRPVLEKTLTENFRTRRILRENYNRLLESRSRDAANISRLSPFSLLEYALESTAETSLGRRDHFFSAIHDYSIAYDAYLKEKIGFVPISGSDFRDFHVNGHLLRVNYFQRPNLPKDTLKFPAFKEKPLSFAQVVRDFLPDLSGLLIWNLALALGAFLAFNRADVR